MADVQHFRISNTDILNKLKIEPVQDIAFSRQLHWLGKIPRMQHTRLPRKMLGCWLNDRRPTGRPYTTIRHTYIQALKRIDLLPEDDKIGKFSTWFCTAQDQKNWNLKRNELINRSNTYESF